MDNSQDDNDDTAIYLPANDYNYDHTAVADATDSNKIKCLANCTVINHDTANNKTQLTLPALTLTNPQCPCLPPYAFQIFTDTSRNSIIHREIQQLYNIMHQLTVIIIATTDIINLYTAKPNSAIIETRSSLQLPATADPLFVTTPPYIPHTPPEPCMTFIQQSLHAPNSLHTP